MLKHEGAEPGNIVWVPSTGAATALTDLAGAGVNFVSCSLPEAQALIKAGRLKTLALMAFTTEKPTLYGGSVSTPASARSLNPPMLNTAVYPMS